MLKKERGQNMKTTKKINRFLRAAAVATAFTMLFCFMPQPAQPAYGASSGAEPTALITVVARDGSTKTVANLAFDPMTGTLRATAADPYVSAGTEFPIINQGFSYYASYNYDWNHDGKPDNVLVYSGLNRANPRIGLVRKGFTMDALKAYIKAKTGITINSDTCKIQYRAAGLPWMDMSTFDDSARYTYRSYMKWPTMDYSFVNDGYHPALATKDKAKKAKAFNNSASSRTTVPLLFAIQGYIQQDIGVGARKYTTDAMLDRAVAGLEGMINTSDSLRIYRGQLQNNDLEETLGSTSIYNIDQIKFTPNYRIDDAKAALSKISFSKPPSKLKKGKSKKLTLKFSPSSAKVLMPKYVSFKSSKSKVISVSATGKIKALKKGTAKITATVLGKKCSKKIKVY